MNTQAALLALATKLPETSGLRVKCPHGGIIPGEDVGWTATSVKTCPLCAGRGWTLAPDPSGEKLRKALAAMGYEIRGGYSQYKRRWFCDLTLSGGAGSGNGNTELEATVRAAAQALGVEVSE